MDRKEQLLKNLDKSMKIIEIGPSYQPLVPKRDGWRTTVADHATREALLSKYAGHGVDLSVLEEVDVVWDGGDLAARFAPGEAGSFDAVVASHVIEHMPDPISFLMSVATLLRPEGMAVLAVPDKRYCFDFFQPMTTTGDWLSAHQIKPGSHPKRVAFNHLAYSVSSGGRISWDQASVPDLRLVHSLPEAMAHFAAANDAGRAAYLDYHAWRFTPSSFQLILLEAALLCDVPLHVEECSPAVGCEFFVVLRRGRPAVASQDELNERRLALLKRGMLELKQQADLFAASQEVEPPVRNL